VLPGFINAHVHGALSLARLEAWAQAGVTTVRDLGCSPGSLVRFRELCPPYPGRARLVAAGPLITVPDGYPIVPFGSGWVVTISSEEEARTVAEDLLDSGGADLLKLALETGTVFGQTIPVLSPQEAAMLVRVAHGRGTVASAHITSVVDLELALSSGVDDLAHMAVDREIPDAILEQIVAADVVWVPTLELWRCTGSEGMAVHNLGRFVAAGGTVAMGTDYLGYTCSWDGGMPMTEIELMAEAGMSPMEIIVASTGNAAAACNLARDLGTAAKGMIADLIVVDGDPLEDLRVLEEVRLVIHDGTVIRNELATWLGPSPRQPTGRAGYPPAGP
jgi:imidazolonepropionase-like amidohydrolase